MTWFVSKTIDISEAEFFARMEFYQNFRKNALQREAQFEDALQDTYVFNDTNVDNRFMIIGHAGFAIAIIRLIKSSTRKWLKAHEFYVCACIMSHDYFYATSGICPDDKVFVTFQKYEFVEEDNEAHYTCEFLDPKKTGFGFKATRCELALYNSERKSFYGKLKECFFPLERYKIGGCQ